MERKMGIQHSSISTAHMVETLASLLDLAVRQDKLFLAYILAMALTEAKAKRQKNSQ
jgi:hypothetical protein